MRARLDRAAPDHDLEIDELAQENFLVDPGRIDVTALLARLRELDVLGADLEHDFFARLERIDPACLQLADLRADAVEPARPIALYDIALDEVGRADEIGNELVARPLVDLARRADLLDAPAVH